MSPFTIDSTNFFAWRGIKIYQHEAVHKVGTDAVLLGSWAPGIIGEAEYILDAGTGSGILALMMATVYPNAKIDAIDIDQMSLHLAAFNATQLVAENRVRVAYANILEHPIPSAQSYDLILSNPPFYNTQILPVSESKIRAKHISVPVGQWVYGLLNRLSVNGHLCIIVPGEAAAEWISTANEIGYYTINRLDVYSFSNDPLAKRSLLHFTTELRKPNIRRLIIYSKNKSYTSEYLELTGIRSGL